MNQVRVERSEKHPVEVKKKQSRDEKGNERKTETKGK